MIKPKPTGIRPRIKVKPKPRHFNDHTGIYQFHKDFGDVHFPRYMRELKEKHPDVWAIVQDVSWDRQYATIIWMLTRS